MADEAKAVPLEEARSKVLGAISVAAEKTKLPDDVLKLAQAWAAVNANAATPPRPARLHT